MIISLLATLVLAGALRFAVAPDGATTPTAVGRVYGYVRVSTDKQALSPESQRHTIEQAAAQLGRRIDGWFQDAPTRNADGSWNDAQSGKIPLPERTAGNALCACVRRGDLVLVAKVDRAFRKLSDCVLMLDRWERAGVHLYLCDFPTLTDLANPFGKALIQIVAVFAEIERKLISQRTREALALRARKNQATSRYPGYGFRWDRRWDADRKKHVKVRVRDDEERRVMGLIVKWRVDGYGWDAITRDLDRQKVRTRDGTPWSRARVIRAFRAELQLQARESRDAV